MLFRKQITSFALVAAFALCTVIVPSASAAQISKGVSQAQRFCAIDAVKLDTMSAYGTGMQRSFGSQIVLHGVHLSCMSNVSFMATSANGKEITFASGLRFMTKKKYGNLYKVELDVGMTLFDKYETSSPGNLSTNPGAGCSPVDAHNLKIVYFYGGSKRINFIGDVNYSICSKMITANYKSV